MQEVPQESMHHAITNASQFPDTGQPTMFAENMTSDVFAFTGHVRRHLSRHSQSTIFAICRAHPTRQPVICSKVHTQNMPKMRAARQKHKPYNSNEAVGYLHEPRQLCNVCYCKPACSMLPDCYNTLNSYFRLN